MIFGVVGGNNLLTEIGQESFHRDGSWEIIQKTQNNC